MVAFVEPSILSFDPAKHLNNYASAELEIKDFKAFLENLEEVLQVFTNKDLKISISGDFWEAIMKRIPVAVYDGMDSRYLVARELYIRKLPRFLKKIHNYGDHSIEGEFDSSQLINNQLLNLDIYMLWVDLLLSNLKLNYPSSLLKSQFTTIHSSKRVIINNSAGPIEYKVYDNPLELCNCPNYIKFSLRTLIKSEIACNTTCHGTGDHDSMWGSKIKGITDVPHFERELLIKFLETKLIKELVFLDFDKASPAAESPYIKIIEVKEGDSGDIMYCELHGRGVKQNSQKISILIKSGYGTKILVACEGIVNDDFLTHLLTDTA